MFINNRANINLSLEAHLLQFRDRNSRNRNNKLKHNLHNNIKNDINMYLLNTIYIYIYQLIPVKNC